MQAFLNRYPPDIHALFSQFLAQFPAAQIEQLTGKSNGLPVDFIPLNQETRTHVSTAVMCRHLGRAEQTARGWASAETFPDGLRPLRINGRLAWPVAGIRRLLLGVAQ